ncbi:MAG: hypothetical protein AB7O24_17880 [Kofleriaceae bacterium]
MRAVLASVVLATFTVGCVDSGKGEEQELLDEDGKADTHRKPTDHGILGFGEPGISALTDAERYHAWTFELSGTASIEMTTSYAVLGQRRTDTVLYLYKESASGWGPYIARNDDYGDTTYSQLVRELGAGRYRVLVKGFAAATRGKFKVTVNCSGEGCAPPEPDACVFGSTYNDIPSNGALETINSSKITAANVDLLSARDQQLLVIAVQQSSHTDVTTPLEALGRVDQGEINLVWLAEPAARRGFIAFEYGAGDNSYGAIFERVSGDKVTSIHDGDLLDCTVSRETCLLPQDWSELRASSEFTQTTARVITEAGQLTGIEADQAIATFRQSYDDVTTVADGLDRVDENKLNVQTFTHVASGREIVVFEYGAGDTSVGMIFYPNSLDHAGVIDDLFITGCTLFAS